MFVRKVTLQLKPNVRAEFTRLMEKEIIPTLRKQKGFKDEMTFLGPDGKDAFALSFWETKENAENYVRDTYPTVLKTLTNQLENTPQVHVYELINSTPHMLAVGAVA